MGMSIYLENDEKVEEIYECQCEGRNALCECNGTGKVSFVQGKHEFHITYSSGQILFEKVGLEFDYCGHIMPDDAADLLDVICKGNLEWDWKLNRFFNILRKSVETKKPIYWG